MELGAASGEFTKFIFDKMFFDSYTALDLEPGRGNPKLKNDLVEAHPTLEFIQGDVQNLNFKNATFDITFSTCLLAHLDDPLQGAKEAIRVTKAVGKVLFLLPSDPGVLNQLIKKLFTYPKMRKQGIDNPKFLYAMEHKNHISRIITLVDVAAEDRETTVKYFPVNLPTWNFSLWAIVST